MTQVDLAVEAEERGMSAASPRFGVLLDYMDVMGWVEADLFDRDPVSCTVRRITARGLPVMRET